MGAQDRKMKFGVIFTVLAIAVTALTVAEAADQDEVNLRFRARAVSALSIERATSDSVDIRLTRLSTDGEREALVKTLMTEGNHALAAALADEAEAGWVSFDPRGGGGAGRDPRKAHLRYAREVVQGNTKEVILITNQFIGFGSNPQGANGAKLAEYPISFVLLRFQKDDDGGWQKGIGRMFVGARVKFDSVNKKFVIDEFPTDPVYLKDVTLK